MATFSPIGFQFFDANGTSPLAGGKVYTYAAGTTDAKPTYTSAAGTTSAANPIILNSAGRAVFFLGEGAYKFVVKDSSDNTIQTIDGINGSERFGNVDNIYGLKALKSGQSNVVYVSGLADVGDGGGGWFYWDADSPDTPDQDHTLICQPNSSPSTGRWKRIIDGNYSLKWFSSITNALTAIGSTKCTLEIPEDVTLDGNTTFLATNDILIINGAKIYNNGFNLTIGKCSNPPDSQWVVYSGSGTITFAKNAVKEVNAAWFGVDDTGATDAAAKIQIAIDSVEEGGIVRIPNGEFRIESTITKTGKPFTIVGSENSIIRHAHDGQSSFDFGGEWEFTDDVSNITLGNYYDTLTVATNNSSSLSNGDILKIISDDLQDHGRADWKMGEFIKVHSASGTTIVLDGKIRQDFLTNIATNNCRIAKLNKNIAVNIKNLIFDADPDAVGDAEEWNSRIITLRYTFGSIIENITCRNGFGPFIRTFSTVDTKISNCSINNLRNSSSPSIVGYGVVFTGDSCAIMSDCSGSNLRHLVTTNNWTGTEIEYYGGAENCFINNCVCFNPYSTGFDTHADSYNVVFSNCHVYGGGQNGFNDASGFSGRGKRTRFANCTANNCDSGFASTAIDLANDGIEIWENDDDGMVFENCHAFNCIDRAFVATNKFKVINCDFESHCDAGALQIGNISSGVSGSIKNTRIKFVHDKDIDIVSTTAPRVISYGLAGNCTINIENVTIDTKSADVTGAVLRILHNRGRSNELKGFGLIVRCNLSQVSSVLSGVTTSGLVSDTSCDLTVGSSDAGTDIVTLTAHGMTTGDKILPLTTAAGITGSRPYFIRKIDDNTFTIHTTPEDANANTNILNLTGDYGGNIILHQNCLINLNGVWVDDSGTSIVSVSATTGYTNAFSESSIFTLWAGSTLPQVIPSWGDNTITGSHQKSKNLILSSNRSALTGTDRGQVQCIDEFAITTAGKGIRIKEGSNARMGVATLVAGTVTVSNTSVTANSRITLTRQSVGSSTALGHLTVGTVTASTSFVINAQKADLSTLETNDVSVVLWELKEPA